MHPTLPNTTTLRWLSRRVRYGVFWACCVLALASCLLWRKYPAGASILAALCLVGVIFLLISRRVRNLRDPAGNDGIRTDDARTDALISVIICSIDPVKYELVCANLRDRFGDSPYEVIGIHDAKSLCEGYNRGVEKSRGDILIFCHDDIEIISPRFASLVRQHLQTFDLIGCAGTALLKDSRWMSSGDPHIYGVTAYPAGNTWPSDLFHVSLWGGVELAQIGGMQALDGVFIAANRDVVESVRFDEETFDGFHGYDTDFTYTAFLQGFKLAVCKDILIAHQSDGDFEGSYKTYARKFREKYKNSLPEEAGDGTCEQTNYFNVGHAQMLKAWS